MKTKRIFQLVVIVLGAITLSMSTSCGKEKEEDPPVDPSFTCSGVLGVEITGFMEKDICFDKAITYYYNDTMRVSLYSGLNNDTKYNFDLAVTGNKDVKFTGPGTYNCGDKMPGFVELRVNGANNEFYKSQSGTITISKSSGNSFEGTFSVSALGSNNGKKVELKGSFKYSK